MKIWPVIVDGGPECLRRNGQSLLLTPLGDQQVGKRLLAQLSRVTHSTPFVCEPAGAGAAYTPVRAEFASAVVLAPGADASEMLVRCELSDALLFVTPECLIVDDVALTSVVAAFAEAPLIAHSLVAFEEFEGSKEHVSVDHSGLVRGIYRFYNQATWSVIAGIGATVVPVAAIARGFVMPTSLAALREDLARRGVMNRDLPVSGGILNLSTELGLLAANERFALEAATAAVGTPVLVGDGHRIAPEARLVGPVVIHRGAQVQADATIVGPTVIGAGAVIGRGAVVAHAMITAGALIPPNARVVDRLWSGDDATVDTASSDRHASYQERLTRLAVDPVEEFHTLPIDDSSRRLDRFVKRAIDAVAAGAALLVLSPLIALCGLAVLIESRGPIFYGDKREGRGGKEFRCWKFRTMFTGAHQAQRELNGLDQTDGPHFKVDRDPRVTKVGRVLRALNLDELPQLFNVLTGEMSLVGPRPSPFRENQVCVPWREARLSVRPGITGFWQVCRHDRAAGDFHQWIEYDLLYVQHQSVWLDIKILAATVVTLGGKAGHVGANRLIPWLPAETMTTRSASSVKSGEPDSQAAA
jgi:lipopolysaccharide/colanic/teichoic acid biosynthesis glycosyltransferase